MHHVIQKRGWMLYYEKIKELMNDYQDLILGESDGPGRARSKSARKRSMRIWPMRCSIWMLMITA